MFLPGSISAYFLAVLLFSGCQNKASTHQPSANDATYIHTLNNAMAEAVILDGFTPPLISRMNAYTHIAAYEAAIATQPDFVSYKNQLNGLTYLPALTQPENYIAEIAVVRAFCRTAVYFTWRDYLLDTIEHQLLDTLRLRYNPTQMAHSIAYGDSVAAAILAWVAKDNYGETRKMSFYVLKKKDWSWELTPSQFMEAVEPYWNLVRPFCARLGLAVPRARPTGL
ncbi:MAG: hypothetical protein IPN33_25835 [Saprospiraceae bacterium]|nr:hypothetical protein [Saprospiraceae bacterium]